MYVNFNEDAKKVIKHAKGEMLKLNHPYVGSEHIILSMLKNYDRLESIFRKQHITYDKFKQKLIDLVGTGSKKSKFILYTPLLRKIISNSVIEAREENKKIVGPERILIQILNEEKGVAYTVMTALNMNFETLKSDVRNLFRQSKGKKGKLLLEELGTDLVSEARENKLDPVIGRDKEINDLIKILVRRKKNNPILIGPSGVGKTAIVEQMAYLISRKKVPKYLLDKRIIFINIFSLVAGTKYRGEFEEKMKTIIKELEDNPDIILFIDEVHTIVGAGSAEGAIDASNIFKPALARGNIKIIGATTTEEYSKYIKQDAALNRRFQKIYVGEPSKKALKNILLNIKKIYETFHNVILEDDLIDVIIDYSSKYIEDRYEPDRSIDILDEVCSMVSLKETKLDKEVKRITSLKNNLSLRKKRACKYNNYKLACKLKEEENKLDYELEKLNKPIRKVTKADIKKIIEEKHNCKLLNYDNNYYKKLEKSMKDNILGRDKEIEKFIYCLKKYKLTDDKLPFKISINGSDNYSFTKDICKCLNNNVIELDLENFEGAYSVNKLIGYPSDVKNDLFSKIKLNPFSLIIIKNYNKASFEVLGIIDEILKNGYSYDIKGNKISFKNTMFFMLFNKKKNNIGFGNNNFEENDLYFKYVINMDSINEEKLDNIIDDKITFLKNKYRLNIKLSNETKYKLLDKCKNDLSMININDNLNKIVEDKVIDNIIISDKTLENIVI